MTHHNLRNEFIHRGTPIKDAAYFYGRHTETQTTLHAVQSGQSIQIIGPRHIGKTSFLHHLAQSNPLQKEPAAHDQHPFIYIDSQTLRDQPPDAIYALLYRKLHTKLPPEITEHLPQPCTTLHASDFLIAIETILQHIKRITYMLDDFAGLSENPHLDIRFFDSLRAIATSGAAFLTTSTIPLHDLMMRQGHDECLNSPFFNIFTSQPIGLFSYQEAQNYLIHLVSRGGGHFTPSTLTHLLDLAGPHPLYLNHAGYHAVSLHAAHGTDISDTTYDELKQRFLQSIEPYWKRAFNKLTPEEQRMLVLLSVDGRPELQRLQHLLALGLVRKEGTTIVALSPSFQEFTWQQPVDGLIQAYPFILDPSRRLALMRGTRLSLAPTEFALLECLAKHPNHPVTHTELRTVLCAVVGSDPSTDPAAEGRQRTTLRELREKITKASGKRPEKTKHYIVNVPMIGYILTTDH